MTEADNDISDTDQNAGIENGARGRKARSPFQIPLKGWRDIGLRLFEKLQKDQIGLIGAGIAFYFFLAIFPAIAVLVSLYGLFADPAVIMEQINQMSRFLPQQVVDILARQAQKIVQSSDPALSISLAVSILLTVFSASKGVKGIIKGLNITYNEDEDRNIILLNLLAMGLTVSVVLVAAVFLAFIAILPVVLNILPLPEDFESLLRLSRWPVLFFLGVFTLEFIYRYAPSRSRARWRWLSLGSFLAAVLWLGFSALFSWYVSNFGKYNETYGALSAVIISLIWFWISAVTALLGAEINSVIEHQTKKDSTIGEDKPMGERGAHVADTVGKVP